MSEPLPSTPAAAPPRILIVDDEEIVLVALRETLKQQGYLVVTAPGPVPALGLLTKETFAVILTDQMMPEITGLELLARAKEMQPDATRILITAVLNLNTVIDAINKAEIYRFILKPWQREEFLKAIRGAVDRYQAIVGQRAALAAAQAENTRLARLVESLPSRDQDAR